MRPQSGRDALPAKLAHVNVDRLKLRDMNANLESKVLSLTKSMSLEKERAEKAIAEFQSSQDNRAPKCDSSYGAQNYDRKLDEILGNLESMRSTLEQHS